MTRTGAAHRAQADALEIEAGTPSAALPIVPSFASGSKLRDRNTILGHYSGAMRETDADRFLSLAEECLKEAEKAISPLDRDTWLKLAEEWLQLARAAKERGR
jgi:hypothetical protein